MTNDLVISVLFLFFYELEESFFWTGDQLFDLIWALLFVLLFLFRTRWKNPYNVSHVLNRWSMTLFLPICDRFTGRAKHYAPGRKKMLKPQSSCSIFPRKKILNFYFTEERKYQSANNHICSRNRFFRGEDSQKIQKLKWSFFEIIKCDPIWTAQLGI